MEITKGKAKVSERGGLHVRTDKSPICEIIYIGDGTAEPNAKLIAEAFNVANETGYSPRELADRNAELLETLKAVQLEAGVLEHNWDYREVEYMPKVIKAIQKSIKQ